MKDKKRDTRIEGDHKTDIVRGKRREEEFRDEGEFYHY